MCKITIFLAGLVDVIIYSSPDDKKKNRWAEIIVIVLYV